MIFLIVIPAIIFWSIRRSKRKVKRQQEWDAMSARLDAEEQRLRTFPISGPRTANGSIVIVGGVTTNNGMSLRQFSEYDIVDPNWAARELGATESIEAPDPGSVRHACLNPKTHTVKKKVTKKRVTKKKAVDKRKRR